MFNDSYVYGHDEHVGSLLKQAFSKSSGIFRNKHCLGLKGNFIMSKIFTFKQNYI